MRQTDEADEAKNLSKYIMVALNWHTHISWVSNTTNSCVGNKGYKTPLNLQIKENYLNITFMKVCEKVFDWIE